MLDRPGIPGIDRESRGSIDQRFGRLAASPCGWTFALAGSSGDVSSGGEMVLRGGFLDDLVGVEAAPGCWLTSSLVTSPTGGAESDDRFDTRFAPFEGEDALPGR